jgi:hypothetical protein
VEKGAIHVLGETGVARSAPSVREKDAREIPFRGIRDFNCGVKPVRSFYYCQSYAGVGGLWGSGS